MTDWRGWFFGVSIICAFALFATAPALADPRADLDRAVADIAKTPLGGVAEATAMEMAIAAARALKPAPAVPDATIAFEGRAEAAAKAAKDKSGFKAAADEFGKAARVAPWVPAYHFNRGVLLEKAEDYTAAKRSLELYLKAAPTAPDAREVKKKIAGLDYLASRPKTAPPQPPAATAPKASPPPGPNVTPQSLSGLWKHDITSGWRDVYELQPVGGNRIVLRFVRTESDGSQTFFSEISLTMSGLNIEGTRTWRTGSPERYKGAVSSDRRSILIRSVNDSRRTMLFVRYP